MFDGWSIVNVWIGSVKKKLSNMLPATAASNAG